MGSVLVARMVQEELRELDTKKVHPFFVQGSTDLEQPAPNPDDGSENDPQNEGGMSGGRRKRRKTDSSEPLDVPEVKKPRGKRQSDGLPKQTTLNTPTIETCIQKIPTDIPTPPLSDASALALNQIVPIPPSTTTTNPSEPMNVKAKVLKFNPKTGTLGSPPKPKAKSLPSRLVCIKYGPDETKRNVMGDKITQILEGKVLFPPSPPKARGRKPKAVASNQTTASSKTPHPFFSSKAKQTTSAKESKLVTARDKSSPLRQTVFMSTPISPRKTRNPFTDDSQLPRFGVQTGVTKVPGAMQPLWPAKGMAHVRGFDLSIGIDGKFGEEKTSKKSKGSLVTVAPDESVLGGFCISMDFTALKNSLPKDDNSFEPAPEELRMPKRHFESGRRLQRRIRSQLRTYKPAPTIEDEEDEEDGLANTLRESKRTHPAISRLYTSLEDGLSAYDRSTCESMAWTQKYAPTAASQVVQAGKEAILLREWLEALKVQSVETGAEGGATKGKGKSDMAPKKRRKKDKLDGFIVGSDGEANEMDEVSEDEDDWAPAGSGMLKKTVIRSGNTATKGVKGRLINAVVISGPQGSGKTAAVYAVAKDLGFEIFEINSSSRRSGKDILERVGDMTRNHLVQQHRANLADDEGEDGTARDIQSGKQGMMTAFFKAKSGAPVKKPTETTNNSSTKNQKQSLILLEEVDILYQEDKQFWTTLIELIAQSKRPFIMTCNDESMVPLQSLSLHGVFRFSPPPMDLAVDLSLLVAANEGHVLRRDAVEALYKSRHHDLRATLTELNYWCQIGVGDRKGGFDWFFLRWPKGTDLDEHGDVVRVVSEDTYYKGMGWIGRDLVTTCSNRLEAEEETLMQSWDSWGLDMGDWENSLDLQSWTHDVSVHTTELSQRLDALATYDDFCQSISDADMLSSGAFGTRFQETLDPGLPDMPAKMREDFIVGRRLLEAVPKVAPSSPSVCLSIAVKSLAREGLLKSATNFQRGTNKTAVLEPINDNRAVSVLGASFEHSPCSMTRLDLAVAFDPIAINEKAPPSTHLDPSVFDRTTRLIVLDVVPWVRGIVEYDHKLMTDRIRLSNILSEGGKRKRMRNTRSAYSALEGGERRTTRREKYFGDCLNTTFVRRTAGEAWRHAMPEVMAPAESVGSITSSPPSFEDLGGV